MSQILIVDDHPVVVEGLQKLVTDKKIARECIVAFSCAECLKIIDIYTPDLILLDYQLPDGNGINLCSQILKKMPEAKILAISSFKELSLVKQMIAGGALGYVLKNASDVEIEEAIRKVLAGKKYLSDDIAESMQHADSNFILTRRELEILHFIADGFTNPEIAEKLFISPLTVDSHRKNLIVKLNAKNTAMLIKVAAQKGFL
ncbi:MAG TPA: response regulator transcription factor [Bacteroidales bacterium]|nr:response regulator transcription factor [Bacteroidales bacterium]